MAKFSHADWWPRLAPLLQIQIKKISQPRALHHHDVAAVPAKAILRISARLRPTCAACFLPSCTRSRKLCAGCFFKHPAKRGFQVEDLHLAH